VACGEQVLALHSHVVFVNKKAIKMKVLNSNDLQLVSAGMSSGTCSALVIGGAGLAGGAVAGYFSFGTGFGAGAAAGGFYGGFIAAYVCY
jgi:hypothetical protein